MSGGRSTSKDRGVALPRRWEFSRRHLSRGTVLHTLKKYGCQIGLEVDRLGRRGIGVHSLRKSAAEDALNKGAVIEQAVAPATGVVFMTSGRRPRKSSAADSSRPIAAPLNNNRDGSCVLKRARRLSTTIRGPCALGKADSKRTLTSVRGNPGRGYFIA